MRVIGTAGHVDHGKSTLVEALTGTHPDRLKEEQERAMTIDLGFAWFNLLNGEQVGVVDVPGHRDFIENMLAGVGGIDAVILVVAADEGVRPQTREHLAILDLLQIPAGVVALTKSELVDDEWLLIMREEIKTILQGTTLENASIVPVSARTGEGLDELKLTLQHLLATRPPRLDLGRPRLPIDRVFSLTGFGTVVTGTLLDGAFTVGDMVEVMPAGLSARVRGAQSHRIKLERALPGSRVALNLAGVEVGDLRRGMVVGLPNTLRGVTLLDAQFRHLPDADLPLKHNAQVKLFVGAAEVLATVRLLEQPELAPGETAWVQLACAAPIVAARTDHFILRRPSPGATIGGGVVVDLPARRHKRREVAVLARLELLARGTPAELLLQALNQLGPVPLAEAYAKANLAGELAAEAVAALRVQTDLIEFEGLALSRPAWHHFVEAVEQALHDYYQAQPLKLAMPREALARKLVVNWQTKISSKLFSGLLLRLADSGRVSVTGNLVRWANHQVQFSAEQQAAITQLFSEFRRAPYTPPSIKDCATIVGGEVFAALVELGLVVMVSAEVAFLAETYAAMVERITNHLHSHHTLTAAEARDLFQTSRKYSLALLEHLDDLGVTKRVGDVRVLKTQNPNLRLRSGQAPNDQTPNADADVKR